MHSYADDAQLYLAFQNPKNADAVHNGCIKVERCLADINAWMTNNKLKLNNDKTEIMLFGTRSSLADVDITSLEVAGTRVHVSDGPVRNLGVLLDNSLSMSSQVNRMVQSACFHLRNIGQVRNKLTESSTKSLVQSLVISRLDYGNSLLCGLPIHLVTKLQLVQNKAARLVTLTKK
jgi:pectin methylesterase-like acyl-CoA thioesterase